MNRLITGLLAIIALAGCTSADNAQVQTFNKKHHIRLYSGGKQIGEWDSLGSVENNYYGTYFYFEDAKTMRLITIDGDVVIETEGGKHE